MNPHKVTVCVALLMAAFALACGGREDTSSGVGDAAASDAGSDARTYCYEWGGPSTIPPDAAGAGVNPIDCVGKCVQAPLENYYFCLYADGGK